MKQSSRTIYLLHEYGDESHFKALYECASKYGFRVSNQMVLQLKSILGRTAKLVLNAQFLKAGSYFVQNIFRHFRIRMLRNEILIVGVAPCNRLLNRYESIFKLNCSYYFTSFASWAEKGFLPGTSSNEESFIKCLSECFKGAFCVTDESSRQLSRYINNTAVVYHAIDCNAYKKRVISSGAEKRYAFVGQFCARKNIHLLLNWLGDHPGIPLTFDFIGFGKLECEIKNAAIRDRRIKCIGRLPKDKLQNILCDYDFVVLPSLDEPFGIILIESLASGTPCIVSNSTGPLEIIQNNVTGFVFELENSAESFNDAMWKSLRLTGADEQRMREAAIESSKSYDCECIINRWMALLKQDNDVIR